MKTCYILIRYSMVLKRNFDFVAFRDNSFSDYKNMIFDSDRMRQREEFFLSITEPSMRAIKQNAPSDIRLRVIILTSEDLPDRNKKVLSDIEKKNSFFSIIYLNEDAKYLDVLRKFIKDDLDKWGKDQAIYATTRLDDDDGVSQDFLVQLKNYLKIGFSNMCVSFSNGYSAIHLNRDCTVYSDKHTVNTSPGMTFIDVYKKHSPKESVNLVFDFLRHRDMDTFRPTIVDGTKKTILYSVHEHSDLSIKHKRREVYQEDKVPVKTVAERFSFIKNGRESDLGRLITYHGSILCYDRELKRIVHKAPRVSEGYLFFDFTSMKLKTDEGKYLSLDSDLNVYLVENPNDSNLLLKKEKKDNLISIKKDDKFLSPKRKREDLLLSSKLADWEIFAVV
ncbi:glycosyltransferase [Carnimonas bestiolae]|uniref:glycosyltransferase n=1 Tax=Carnimonas bestiolae TaxID=3402172 RepID=UPI003EDC3C20